MAIWGDFQGLTGLTRGGVKKLENWGDVSMYSTFVQSCFCISLYNVSIVKKDKALVE